MPFDPVQDAGEGACVELRADEPRAAGLQARGVERELPFDRDEDRLVEVAVDELFTNIASYAYPDGDGKAVIRIDDSEKGAITITLIDWGTPFDPLKHEDPDISLLAEDRPIGGLGIFMVRKTMDDVQYEYKDGMNILTIRKHWD